MTMRFTSAGVLAVAVFVAAAPEEGAASPVWQTSTITFSGQVTSGTDVTGVFGEAGADLSGLRYEMSYELFARLDEGVTYAEYEGWRYEYFTEEMGSGIYSVNMRINDHDFRFASTDWSLARLDSGAKGPNYSGGLDVSISSNNMAWIDNDPLFRDYSATGQVFADLTDFEMRSLLTPALLRAKGPQLGWFGLQRVHIDPNGGDARYPVLAFGTLNAQWMRITAGGIAPVPLPATVGPFLLALGLGGVISRRRKRRT